MNTMRKKALTIVLFVALLLTYIPCVSVKAIVQLPIEATTISNVTITLPNTASATDIQAALDEVSDAGGGIVTLSAGTYTLKDSIELKTNVTLEGQGKYDTCLKKDPDYLVPEGEGFIYSTGVLNNAIVKGLMVDANTDTTPSDTAPEYSTYGVLIVDTNGSSNDKILFDDFKIKNASMGFHVKGTSNLVVKNSDFSYNGGHYLYYHNLYLRRVTQAKIYNCNLNYSSSGNGINISYCENITIDSCQSYSNYFRGIRAADSTGIDIINCNVYNNQTGDGIILNSETTGITDFRVLCCTVSNNGRYGILVNEYCSDGQLWNNLDGGGNGSGYLLNSASNVIDTLTGDANGDQKITAIDAYLVLNHLDTIDPSIGDVNRDDAVNVKDVLEILQVASHEKLYF